MTNAALSCLKTTHESNTYTFQTTDGRNAMCVSKRAVFRHLCCIHCTVFPSSFHLQSSKTQVTKNKFWNNPCGDTFWYFICHMPVFTNGNATLAEIQDRQTILPKPDFMTSLTWDRRGASVVLTLSLSCPVILIPFYEVFPQSPVTICLLKAITVLNPTDF